MPTRASCLPSFMLLLALLWAPTGFARIDNLASIDHLEFFITDLQASLKFYTRVFGANLYKNRQTQRRYLPLGSDYIAIEQRDAARVDHVCIGIQLFDIGDLHDTLNAQGIAWHDYPALGGYSSYTSTATQSSTGEIIDDTVITTRVKTAIFNDPDLKVMEINVETLKGVVQLSGFVSTRAEIDRDGELARGITGVESVRNDILLK